MTMYYSDKEARELVIKACHELVEKKLIARTWGNISARISESEFIITPSGRSYENLKPEELVKVKIDDLSYSGEIKPSSEKGVHAAAYGLRKEISFIIHTHQHYATAVSVEGKNTAFAACVAYALSGTKALIKNTEEAIKAYPESRSFLLERHGALILGESYDEAFLLADELENNSRALFESKKHELSEKEARAPWLDDYAQMFGTGNASPQEDPEAIRLILDKNRAAGEYASEAKPLPLWDVLLQHTVYTLKYSKLKNKSDKE